MVRGTQRPGVGALLGQQELHAPISPPPSTLFKAHTSLDFSSQPHSTRERGAGPSSVSLKNEVEGEPGQKSFCQRWNRLHGL